MQEFFLQRNVATFTGDHVVTISSTDYHMPVCDCCWCQEVICPLFPTAICKKSCIHGQCVGPEKCLCSRGYKGLQCDEGMLQCTKHCQSYVSNFLTITCVLLHHLPQGFLSAAWIMFNIDSRCEWVWFPGETMFPALHEYTR